MSSGQLHASERLLLGLIGAGIAGSRTPRMHEREAEAQGIHCVYRSFDLDTMARGATDLPLLLDSAEGLGFAGLNISHPCRQQVMTHLHDLSPDARGVGAVNTVIFRDGRRQGHNTDWWAFRESFRRGLPNASLSHVVQLGAGGAGAATAYAALQMGAAHLDVVDVVRERADALAQRLNTVFPGRAGSAERADDVLAEASGLIHATPTGRGARAGLALPAALLRPDLWVADVVYVPLGTPLLQAARGLGCQTLDGSGMALWQAVEAFRLFTGRKANVERMRSYFGELIAGQ